MENAKAVSTPVDPSTKLVKTTEDCEDVDQGLYQSAVGSLLHLSTRTRPDIAYAVSNVACFQATLDCRQAHNVIFERYVEFWSSLQQRWLKRLYWIFRC